MKKIAFDKMMDAANEVIRNAQTAYPKASIKFIRLVSASAIEVALDDNFAPPTDDNAQE